MFYFTDPRGVNMGFIDRELERIRRALLETAAGPKYDQLYVAQQALGWVLEPCKNIKSPYDMIIDKWSNTGKDSVDCSTVDYPPLS